MKNYTLIAIVSLATLALIQLAYIFQRFGYSENIYFVTSILQIFAYVGLTSFFIKLYQKQK